MNQPWLVGYNSYFCLIACFRYHLSTPWPNHTILHGVPDMENILLTEGKLRLLHLLIVKMNPSKTNITSLDQLSINIREPKQRWWQRQWEWQKFCTFPCCHCMTTKWNFLISLFVEDMNLRQRLSFSFHELQYSLLELDSRKNANIWRIEWHGISAIKFEAVQIHFLSKVP